MSSERADALGVHERRACVGVPARCRSPRRAADQCSLERRHVAREAQHAPVGDTGTDDPGAEPVGLCHRPCCEEAALAPAADPQSCRVGDTALDGGVHGGENVAPLGSAHVATHRGGESLAVPHATAVVGHQHGVATGGQPLPPVAWTDMQFPAGPAVWAAVGEDHSGPRSLAGGGRADEDAVELPAVGGGEAEVLRRSEIDTGECSVVVRDAA